MNHRLKFLQKHLGDADPEWPWLLLLSASVYLTAALACEITEGETFLAFCAAHAELLKVLFVFFCSTLALSVVVLVRSILNVDEQWKTSLRVIQTARVGEKQQYTSHESIDLGCSAQLVQPGQVPKATGPRKFRLELAKDLLPQIHRHITDFLRENGEENETGGILVGEYSFNESNSTAKFTIRGFIDAGPKAEFSPGSILFDADYQAEQMRLLQLEHRSGVNIGCIHLHPGNMDVCSAGDARTDFEAVRNSTTKALIFGIITRNNARSSPDSVFFQNCKFDFYLMAEETSFEYVPLKPQILDLPPLQSSKAVDALRKIRGPSIVYDLAVLRQLPGLGQTTLRKTGEGDHGDLLLTTNCLEGLNDLHVWVRCDGSLDLTTAAGDGEMLALHGPWEQPENGRQIWLSHLVLLGRGKLSERRPRFGYRMHFAGLLENKHRLVAEVRAMKERFGERAVLCRSGDTLFWEYVIHESGRSLPIQVIYPETFPAEPPQVISMKPLPPSPHQLPGNTLCWIDTYSNHSGWNPARDTAVIAVNAAHRWFVCLLIYLSNGGRWPEGADF